MIIAFRELSLPHPKNPAALAKWEHNLTTSLAENPLPWNAHDLVIEFTVAAYNRYLQKTSGYMPLDWRLIKAVCWVESGAYMPAWSRNPMQIGAFAADAGLTSILTSRQGQIILPPKYRQKLNLANVPVIPESNIQAGTGYFLERMAYFGQLPSKAHAYGITGWRQITFEAVAKRYNGGGDGNYAGKLAFSWSTVTGKKGSIL